MTHQATPHLFSAPLKPHVFGALALCTLGGSAFGQEPAPAEPAPAQEAPAEEAPAEEAPAAPVQLISMGFGDMTTAPVHPKDAALISALKMLDARLAEIPAEAGRDMPPELLPAFEPDSIPVWLRLLTAQKRVSVMGMPEMDPATGMPFLFTVAVDETDEQAAIQYESALKGLLGRMQAPFPMEMIQRNGSALMVDMGAGVAPMGSTQAASILGGGDLSFEMAMDVGNYMDVLKGLMMNEGAPYEALVVFEILGRMGFDELTMEVASKCDGPTSHIATLMSGLGAKMLESGILPEGGISPGHLAPIPADATWASASRMDMEAVFNAMDNLISEFAADQLGGGSVADMIQGTVGIDLRGLFAALGDTNGIYASESTGGGGITSTVMYFSLRDYDAVLETKEQIVEMINAQLAAESDGYASIRTWNQGDDEYTTLMFPGLPIPLEPTIAMSEEWLVIAATPQAAMGAMGQVASGASSFASRSEIAPLLDGTKKGVGFMDAQHFARSGYGMASFMFSSISNGVRSRTDATRNPGPIMPVYSVFKEGIQNSVSYSEVVDGDLVVRQTQDGSAVVQAATLAGYLSDFGLVILAPAFGAYMAPQLARNF